MRIIHTRAEIRQAIAAARTKSTDRIGGDRGKDVRIALVPTMGYLHEGHLSLVDWARARADVVVLSIFVNPLQFGPTEDLARYPRDLERDAALAEARGVDLIFAPEVGEMYPGGEPAVQVVPFAMTDVLCGAQRPGHFQGALTIVAKLFNIVQPDIAVFGQKDFQQAVLIRRMAEDLDLPVEIDVAPIVREADGLAMSSRNVYLEPDERERALALYRGLSEAARAFRSGVRSAEQLKAIVHEAITAAPGVMPQYIELVHPDTLDPTESAEPGTVLAVAAFVGKTRLIDNVILQ